VFREGWLIPETSEINTGNRGLHAFHLARSYVDQTLQLCWGKLAARAQWSETCPRLWFCTPRAPMGCSPSKESVPGTDGEVFRKGVPARIEVVVSGGSAAWRSCTVGKQLSDEQGN
jgi:hypothetical protein